MTLGTPLRRIVLADRHMTKGKLSLTMITYPDNRAGPPEHVHSKEDEAFFVVEGQFAFRLSGETSAVGEGCFVYVPAGNSHAFRPMSATGGRILELFCPADFEVYFEEWASLISASSDTTGAMAQLRKRHGMEVTGPPIQMEDVP